MQLLRCQVQDFGPFGYVLTRFNADSSMEYRQRSIVGTVGIRIGTIVDHQCQRGLSYCLVHTFENPGIAAVDAVLRNIVPTT